MPTLPYRVPVVCAMILLSGLGMAHRVAAQEPSKANLLRGEYGRYRANNDLLYYHLDIRIDPTARTIQGKNSIRFRMLQDDHRIQIDLHEALKLDAVRLGDTALKFERDARAVLIDLPETCKAGREVTLVCEYSGRPLQAGRFGGFSFDKDPRGRPWVYTACEGQGASVWWPNKDQWRDEVESMDISVAVPDGLVDVSNGRFVRKTPLGDGFTRWDWHVSYPINNYCVSVNVGAYEHFSDKHENLDLDFYALPEDLERARAQFAQTKGMLDAFEAYFGPYPFAKDGFKLIQVPYSGMEHQSAVTYGNGFQNGYHGRDWTGVGISPRFDFIIIHESGHEWFGNSVGAADRSDMWIHEGWTTYLESLYVEHRWGKADALKYVNGYRKMVQGRQPIIADRQVNATPPGDQYFKGALFLNTLRSIVDDDDRWKKLLRGVYDRFRYKTIMTEDLIAFFNQETGKDLTPIFNQYLRHTAIPVLELRHDAERGEVNYRWKTDEAGFAMPVRVGRPDAWQTIVPTADWKVLKTTIGKDEFQVATDLYYIDVRRVDDR